MKRLLRIGFDIFITSLTPIIIWLLIGIIINKDLINVFTLTYPLQCLMGIIVSIFGVGANVSGIKDKNENSVNNAILYGTLISLFVFGIIALNCKYYIKFMNMNEDIYLIMNKLYYLELNKYANKISFLFNFITFITLIGTALITKNQLFSTSITIITLAIFDIILFIKNIDKIDFKINLKNYFKYDSVSCSINILYFIMYLFGFSNSFSFGQKYVTAITFVTLITDVQWDVSSAIKNVAKIDIVKEKFISRIEI